MMLVEVSVVLPTYNEEAGIAARIAEIKQVLSGRSYEILVVDDSSPDRTAETVENLNDSHCRLIRRQGPRGLAVSLAEGAWAARGKQIVFADADSGIPAQSIPDLLAMLENCDLAVGSRYVAGGADLRPRFRAFLSQIFNGWARFLLGSHFRDYTSGFVAFRAEILKKAPVPPSGHGDYFIEWIYLCLKRGCRVKEVGYLYALRKVGVSKTDGNPTTFLKHAWRYFCRAIKAKWTIR